jgi:hypothetical protein
LKKAKATGGAFGQTYACAVPETAFRRYASRKSKMSYNGPYRSTLGKSFKCHQYLFKICLAYINFFFLKSSIFEARLSFELFLS